MRQWRHRSFSSEPRRWTRLMQPVGGSDPHLADWTCWTTNLQLTIGHRPRKAHVLSHSKSFAHAVSRFSYRIAQDQTVGSHDSCTRCGVVFGICTCGESNASRVFETPIFPRPWHPHVPLIQRLSNCVHFETRSRFGGVLFSS
jgi:hypothetical protein